MRGKRSCCQITGNFTQEEADALAETLRQIARDGGESFYRGEIAESIVSEVEAGGGILSPRADVRLGLDFGHGFVLATAEIQRRWMWGRDDITLVQAGLAVGVGPPFQRPEPPTR